MGLDLLVVPLSSFLAGRYQGPIEHLAKRIGNPKPDESDSVARERVRGIREELERRAEKPLSWAEEGEAALAVQYHYRALQAIRAYAAHQDYPQDGGFRLDGSPESHPSLMKVYYQNAPTRYRHLIDHSDCMGFYVPCEFEEPLPCREVLNVPAHRESVLSRWFGGAALWCRSFKIPGMRKALREYRRAAKEEARRIERMMMESPFPRRKMEPMPKVPRGHSVQDWGLVGSSIRLLKELDALNQGLRLSRDWGHLDSGEPMAPEGDPLGEVKYGWAVLHYAARISVEKRMPIVFDG